VGSRGAGTTHITLDRSGKYVLVANYDGGSVAVFRLLEDGKLGESTALAQHAGSSVNRERQEGPHPHEVAVSRDNRFVVVTDLGTDEIFVYPFDARRGTLGQPQITKTSPGAGPRHMVFSANGKHLYVINELSNSIVVYGFDVKSGQLREQQKVSTLPKDFSGINTTAEIQLDSSGKFLYGSNRGADNIARFAVDPKKGTLGDVAFASTEGKAPRFFSLDPTGKWLFAANQTSGNIVIFRVDESTGKLTSTGKELKVPAPVCLTFVAER
jgi:6-phosphogluconolactonase